MCKTTLFTWTSKIDQTDLKHKYNPCCITLNYNAKLHASTLFSVSTGNMINPCILNSFTPENNGRKKLLYVCIGHYEVCISKELLFTWLSIHQFMNCDFEYKKYIQDAYVRDHYYSYELFLFHFDLTESLTSLKL